MKNQKSYIIGSACMVLAIVILLIAGAYLVPALAPGSQSNMALAIDNGRDEEPLIGVYFRLDLDGNPVGYFTICNHIGSESEVVEHKLVDGSVRKVPGKLSWYNVILSRGITSDTQIWEWRRQVEEGNMTDARGIVHITMLDNNYTEVAWWELTNAWPCRIEGPGDIIPGYVSVEEIEIACERMERLSSSP